MFRHCCLSCPWVGVGNQRKSIKCQNCSGTILTFQIPKNGRIPPELDYAFGWALYPPKLVKFETTTTTTTTVTQTVELKGESQSQFQIQIQIQNQNEKQHSIENSIQNNTENLAITPLTQEIKSQSDSESKLKPKTTTTSTDSFIIQQLLSNWKPTDEGEEDEETSDLDATQELTTFLSSLTHLKNEKEDKSQCQSNSENNFTQSPPLLESVSEMKKEHHHQSQIEYQESESSDDLPTPSNHQLLMDFLSSEQSSANASPEKTYLAHNAPNKNQCVNHNPNQSQSTSQNQVGTGNGNYHHNISDLCQRYLPMLAPGSGHGHGHSHGYSHSHGHVNSMVQTPVPVPVSVPVSQVQMGMNSRQLLNSWDIQRQRQVQIIPNPTRPVFIPMCKVPGPLFVHSTEERRVFCPVTPGQVFWQLYAANRH